MRCGSAGRHWRLRGGSNGAQVFLQCGLELVSLERRRPLESARFIAVVGVRSRNLVTNRAQVRLIWLTPPHLTPPSCAPATSGMVRRVDHPARVLEDHICGGSYGSVAHRVLGVNS